MKTLQSFFALLLAVIVISSAFAQTASENSTPKKSHRQLRIENEIQVQAVHKEARQKIENVESRIKNLADRSQEIQLQKEIEKIKSQAEIDALKLRLEFYNALGDTKTAKEIEVGLDKLQNPEKFRPETPKVNRQKTQKTTAR